MANPNKAWMSVSRWKLLGRDFETSGGGAERARDALKAKYPGAIVKITRGSRRDIYGRYSTIFTVSAYEKPKKEN